MKQTLIVPPIAALLAALLCALPAFGTDEETTSTTFIDASMVFDIPPPPVDEGITYIDIHDVFTEPEEPETPEETPAEPTVKSPAATPRESERIVIDAAPVPTPLPTPTPTPTPTPKPIPPIQQLSDRELYRQAMDLISRRRNDEAKLLLLKIVEDFPASPNAPGAMYQLALIERDITRKINTLSTLLRTYPESPWSDPASFKIGDLHFMNGNYIEALSAFKAYVKAHEDGQFASESNERIAACYLKIGDHKRALMQYERLFDLYPETYTRPEIYDAIAECYILLGDLVNAVKVLDYTLKKFPNYRNNSSLYLSLFLCHEDLGNTSEAYNAYQELIQSYPKSFQTEVARGFVQESRRHLFDNIIADAGEAGSGEGE